MRPSRRKIQRAAASTQDQPNDYAHQVYTSPKKCSQTIQALPKIYAPKGRRYIQQPNLHIPSGQLGLLERIPGAPASNTPLPKSTSDSTHTAAIPVVIHDTPVVISLHRRKRIAQNNRWMTEMIPRLVRPYLRMMRKTQNLRVEPQTEETECTCLIPSKVLSVLVLRLYSKTGNILFMILYSDFHYRSRTH